jgi:hypothetical protein
VIRVESRGRRVLVTVRTNPNIKRIPTEEVRHAVEVESAVRAIGEFLTAFTTRADQRSAG